MTQRIVLRGLVWMLALLSAQLALGSRVEMRLDRCRHQFWKVSEGLPDNEVKVLLQTRDSYLWIGTRSGLARFDGDKFTIFDHLNTPELEDDDIVALAEDPSGALWIGARKALICKRGSTFQRWDLHELDPETFVNAVCAASDGSVWIATLRRLMRVENGHIQSVNSIPNEISEVQALTEYPRGTLWMGGMGGACTYDLNTGKSRMSFTRPSTAPGLVTGFTVDALGQFSLCAGDQYEPSTSALYQLSEGQWVRRQPVVNGGRKLFVTARSDGSLWQPGSDGYIAQWTTNKVEYKLPFAGYALCALEDREHNLWIGAESGGLHCFYWSSIDLVTTEDHLADDNTWTVLQAKDGSVWIGTEVGLSQLNHGTIRNFTEKDGLSRNVIRALAEDQTGRIWIGTGAGLNCLDHGRLQSYQFAGEWENTKIRTLLVGRGNLLWVGTVRGLYAVELSSIRAESSDSTNRVLIKPTLFLNSASGLAEDVRTLLEDQSGALWIGSYDKGLHRLQNGVVTHFTSREGLLTNRIWALHESADGTLWIGTEAGLYRYRDGAFVAFTRKQGLWDNVINEILEDDEGWIWLGGDNGIHAVRRAHLEAVAKRVRDKVECDLFVESDGLLSRETNGQKSQPAGWKSQDGRLWFPTTRGVAVIDPREVRKNRFVPLTVIEQVRANGRVVFGDSDVGVQRAPSEPRPGEMLRLPAGQGDVVEIRYTGNHFGGADQLRFQYRLKGLHEEWIEAGNRRFAYYAHLPPGDYQFEVMAGTHHNVWDTQGAAFSFVVAPHFYERWTVRAGALVLVGALVFGLFGWRLQNEREKQKLKEAAVLAQERSRIARNLHDEFGASLTAIRMLADLVLRESNGAQTIPHLQKMSQAVIDTGQTLRQIIWTNHPSDETWTGLINRIHQYGEEFLGAAEIQCLFEEAGQAPRWPVSPNVRLELFRATKEAFHNVAKHAHASAVKLGVCYQNGQVTLIIEDDGKGFDFDAQRAKGYGMDNMSSRLSHLGGRLEVQSSIGRGTKICMFIPSHAESLPARPSWWRRFRPDPGKRPRP